MWYFNSVQLFQQLSLAVEYNATRVWILNVGDFKANEIPTDFFLSMAYNASALSVPLTCNSVRFDLTFSLARQTTLWTIKLDGQLVNSAQRNSHRRLRTLS